jgi:hypothetical protein
VGALAGGPIETRGELRESRAWSTMKLPVIVAAIAAGRADWDAIEAAITRSDNDAALRLWHELDDDAAQVEAHLRAVGIAGPTVIAIAARAEDFAAAKRLASKYVPQHPNTP